MNKEILALDKLVSYLERKDSVMAVEFVILYGTFARLWQIHASHGIPLGYEQSDSKGGIVIHSARVDISLDIVEKFADILYRRPIPELSTREADDFYLRPENAKTESIQEHERITIQGLFDTNAHRKNYDYAANRKKGDMDFAYVQYALRRYGEILYSQEELFKTDSDSAGNQIDMSSVFYEQDEYFHLIEDYEGILERKRLKKLLVKAEGVYLPHMEMLRDFFAHIDRYG